MANTTPPAAAMAAPSATDGKPTTEAPSKTVPSVRSDVSPARTDEEKQEDVPEPPPPPPVHVFVDHSFRSWFMVIGGFFASFASWGFVQSFGVFQTYYTQVMFPDQSPSNVAWIGSLQLFLLFFVGFAIGVPIDRGYMSHIMAAASVLYIVCVWTLSVATQFWQVVLAHGIGCGIAQGCLYIGAVSCVPHWFSPHKRAMPFAIVAVGSSISGIIFPLVARHTFETYGFPTTVRILAAMITFALIIANLGCRTRLPPRKGGQVVEFRYLKEPPYALFFAGGFLGIMGLYTVPFFITSFSISIGIDPSLAFYAVSMYNAGSLPGRLFGNLIAQRLGPQNVLIFSNVTAGILTMLFVTIRGAAGMFVFAFVFGFFTGVFVSIMPQCVANLSKSPVEIGSRLGLLMGLNSFASLAGAPAAGAIVKSSGYLGASLESGILIVFGMFVVFCGRTLVAREKGNWRV